MSATTGGPARTRTYGNWSRPSSPGLPGLGTLGTLIALGSLVLVMMTLMVVGLEPALVVLALATIAVVPLWYKNRSGRNGWSAMATHVAWFLGRRRKQHIYRSSVVSASVGDAGMTTAPPAPLGLGAAARAAPAGNADTDADTDADAEVEEEFSGAELLAQMRGDEQAAGNLRAWRLHRQHLNSTHSPTRTGRRNKASVKPTRKPTPKQAAQQAADRRVALSAGITTLPGLLARSSAYDCIDAYGNHFAMLHVPATRHFSVVLRCDPEGSTLVDTHTTETWVSRWGHWLAELAREPNLEAASATVETAPDPGNRLAEEVDNLITPDAPALARQMLEEISASYAIGSPQVHGRVSLTFNATRRLVEDRELFSGKKRRAQRSVIMSPAEMATQIGSRLPTLLHSLNATGVGGVRAMTVTELAEMVRTAYDPQIASELDASAARGRDSGITWAGAGPLAQVEDWGAMRHDSGTSITWQMTEAPRGEVQHQVLSALLEPMEGVARKRVTMLYRPHDPAAAAAIAYRDVRTAIGRAKATRGEARAGDDLALAAARQTAREEASGAGLTRFALMCTATVTGQAAEDLEELHRVADRIDQAGGASRIRLRRVYGGQSAAFAAALGIGVVLSKHTALPDLVRENL